MLLDAAESQLVLVDYQARLMPALFENEAVLANALRLAHLAHLMRVPAWGTEQNPSRLGENAPALRALCQRTLAKMHFSAVEEGLGEWLRPPAKAPQGNARSLPKHLQKPAAPERSMIVVAGCEAHVCLLQTALDLGYDGWMHDFGEYVARSSRFFDGRTGESMHNRFSVLSTKAAYDLLKDTQMDLLSERASSRRPKAGS